MNSKKDITFSNSAFTITIHWNGPAVMTQLSIMIGILLLKWISKNPNVQVLCTVLMILDGIAILIGLFIGSSVESTGEEKHEEKKQEPQQPQETPAEKTTKKSKKSAEQESNAKVTKRVPMPTQQGQRRPDMAPPPPPTNTKVEPQTKSSDSELTEEEMQDLFNF